MPVQSVYESVFIDLICCYNLCICIRFKSIIKKNILSFRCNSRKLENNLNDIINYVFPYVVSFMGITYDAPEKIARFCCLLTLDVCNHIQVWANNNEPSLVNVWMKLYEANISINGQSRTVRILKKEI